MQRDELRYLSADGHSLIRALVWRPEESAAPKAIVQIVHGMAEHIERYDEFARYLAERGMVVCAEDHVGHGKSIASQDELGHIPLNGGKEILVADVHALRGKVQAEYPGVPYILFGHSMGSFISRAYTARHAQGMAALVLMGTGNVEKQLSAGGNAVCRATGAIRGEKHRSRAIDNMAIGGYSKNLGEGEDPLAWLSVDTENVEKYKADPLCGQMFTVGGFAALTGLTLEVCVPEWAAKVPKDLPVLFASGSQDPVGDCGKGVMAAAKLLTKAGVSDVTVKLYEGYRHEILNEGCKAEVMEDIAVWMEGKLCQASM